MRPDAWLTLAEAAPLVGSTYNKLLLHHQAGRLVCYRRNNRLEVLVADLLDWLDRRARFQAMSKAAHDEYDHPNRAPRPPEPRPVTWRTPRPRGRPLAEQGDFVRHGERKPPVTEVLSGPAHQVVTEGQAS